MHRLRLFGTVFLALILLATAGCSPAAEPGDRLTTLVVYYSSNEDGISELAREAAKAARCQMFEIQPEKEYAALLDKLNSSEELSMEELEDLYSTDFKLKQPVPDNWSEYDRIILGCPIWLGGAATPVKLFLDENNLDDKTFYPFTIGTLDETETLSTQLSLDNWRTGFAEAESFEKGASPETVAQWVDSLNSEKPLP
ncbi:flavodoxin [Faecalibaculum rodentium]|uniref:flavodoxin n=1 Tax=Faecalibaculum rodentium TaxID=1702221 RepID=UPI0023F37201|nr:hypothetical protein [Faecalibaculum rodentium]